MKLKMRTEREEMIPKIEAIIAKEFPHRFDK